MNRGTYLVNDDEEAAVEKDSPNEDVTEDPRDKRSGMGHHQGAVPVNGDKGPCQRCRHSRRVDESGIGIVAEVERAQIEKVEDKNQLSPVEVRSHK